MLKVHSINPTADIAWLTSFRVRHSDCSELASREGIQNRFLTKTQRETLDALHQTLPYDPRAQVYIDAYLPCSFLADGTLARANPNVRSELMVLAPGDAPRMGNLPDLGHVIRGALVATLHSRREGCARRPGGGRVTKRTPGTEAGQPGLPIGNNRRPEPDDADDRNHTGESSFGVHCIMQCPLWNSRGWPSHAHAKPSQDDRPEAESPGVKAKEGGTRRASAKDTRWGASKPDTASAFIVLNLTLGSFLGLYPTCQRHPRFATRCALYRRMHHLLTSDAETLAAFVTQHPHLIRMAVLEHICNMLTLFMPVEAALVQTQFSAEDGYAQCAAAFDAFRRDGIDDGLEPWSVYDAHARTAVEQCTRLMQYKRSDAQHDTWAREEDEPATASKRPAWGRVLSESDRCARIRCLLDTPARHTPSHGTSLKGAILNDLIQFDKLPANLTALQQKVHDEAMARCEYRGWQRSVRFVCFNCEARGTDTKYRVDAPTLEVTCDRECHKCLVGVCTIGNVVTLRGRKYTFAPCCGQVVEYNSAHGEGMWAGRCPNEQPRNEVAPPTRPSAGGRYQCKYCASSSSTLVPYVFPSLREVRLVSTYLCKKHSPDETAVRYIYNQEDFERVCDEWVAQHKPWYRRTCSHRRR